MSNPGCRRWMSIIVNLTDDDHWFCAAPKEIPADRLKIRRRRIGYKPRETVQSLSRLRLPEGSSSEIVSLNA